MSTSSTPAVNASPPERGFWPLILTQFQGAFSDNTYKWLLTFLILSYSLAQADRDRLVWVAGALFSIPFVLFSMAGGWLADRFSKREVTIGTKLFEIGIMLSATAGFLTSSLPMLFSCLFLMSTQSALFGPSKYGLLPELLPPKRLSWGNGVLELTTFVAIITGAVTGGYFAEWFAGREALAGGILVLLAALGLVSAMRLPPLPAADPARKLRINFLGDLFGQWKLIRADRVLFLAALGNTYFWFLGALLQQGVVFLGTDVLHLAQQETGLLSAAVAIGIGLGSLAAGYVSGNKIELGLIPLGSIGMSVFGLLVSRPGLSVLETAVHLSFLGFFGGFFVVPVNALLQHRPDPAKKGGVLGAANLLSSIGIFAAFGVYYALQTWLHFSPLEIFMTAGVATLAATAYVLWLLPVAFVRLVMIFVTHTIYRIRVEGRDNIPERGGALFVSNHLSFVDALLLAASTDREIRFLMFQGIYDHPIVKPFARLTRAIPISSLLRPRDMIRSLRAASEAIQNGEVVCIFAEGQITRIGQMLPFRRGFERIMKGVDAPIIPVHLDGVWGSIFSFDQGRFLWKMPKAVPYPTTVSFGRPMPPTATAMEVRQAVQELQSEAYRHRRARMTTLDRSFIRAARLWPLRFFAADPRVPKLCFGSALTKTVFLAQRLAPVWKGQEMVGILLPPSVPGALVNLAALLMGKVPVNLNYTASNEVIASCAAQCKLETVITSKAFLEKVPLQVPGRAVMLEELAENPRLAEKLRALYLAWLFPAPLLTRALGSTRVAALDDIATIIFSSGSTGEPKGVMLTHFNILSNVEQMDQTFTLDKHDRILGILPFFHSFGFTVTICLPACRGVGAVYYPNPLDAQAIGAMVREHAVTFMVATPTFLQTYTRRCQPEDFGSLEYVIVGAEKLSERIAQAFEDRFGLKPLEGYGCTECAPVVAVNTKDFRAPGFRQVGGKRGKIGHPLPGVSVRIVDPDSMQPVPTGTAGLMLVKGPNVMKGYLGKPEKTAEALRDGWYVTGDIAALDEDGFITITDRLTRFSKIGGEMVPHVKVEEKLHELAGATEQCFVVTAVPDGRKGERLVVLHTLDEEKLQPVLSALPECGLPNLWIPRGNQFFRVEKLPYLGSGKLDLRTLKESALNLSQES
jgi:acyl-[acyl-carrier-protein]-phospholipid O-acyltransferase/long-chain-fatty-acid--[acyl-carrier-protein] ligase